MSKTLTDRVLTDKDEEILKLNKQIMELTAKVGQMMGESDPVDFPDGATPSECLGYLCYCANLWAKDARLVGNLRAGDITRALKFLAWSDEVPTEEGYYWQHYTRKGSDPVIRVVHVFKLGENWFVNGFGLSANFDKDNETMWAGPIPVPVSDKQLEKIVGQ